jgi:hypothetical protein
MKLTIGLILAVTLAVGPAAAQGTFGAKPKQTWSPGTPVATPYTPKSYGVPAPGVTANPGSSMKPRTYGAPEAPVSPGFKPYEGYKTHPGTSVFGPDGKKKR